MTIQKSIGDSPRSTEIEGGNPKPTLHSSPQLTNRREKHPLMAETNEPMKGDQSPRLGQVIDQKSQKLGNEDHSKSKCNKSLKITTDGNCRVKS